MIRSKRLNLRPLNTRDASLYEKWINDEETNFWRGLYHPTTTKEATTWIESQLLPQANRLTLAIEASIRGKLTPIGILGLRSICPRSRRAEIWIYLGDKTSWGHGFGYEAAQALCQYAFEEMNLFRIWLETDPQHKAAVRCYEKAGFEHEGTLRKAYYRRGKYRDTWIMGLLRADFEKLGRARA